MYTYEQLKEIYQEYFTLSGLNVDIGSKFALISLICHITHSLQMKKPDVTCYQVIMKILEKKSITLTSDFVKGLSIICEDYMYRTKEFLTFDIDSNTKIIDKISEILSTWTPF